MVKLVRQRHGVGGDDKAPHVFAQRLSDFLGKKGWPQALECGQGSQVLAFFGPGGFGVRHLGPQGGAALAGRQVQLCAVGGQPLSFAAQAAAPAFVRALRKGAQRFGGGQRAFGQVVHGRVEHAGVGAEEGELLPAAVLRLQFLSQQLPGIGGEKAVVLALCTAKEGAHGLRQLRCVQPGLFLGVGHADERKRHRRPMHFGKALQLLTHLRPAGQLGVVGIHACGLQQSSHHGLALVLQPLAYLLLHAFCQRLGLAGGHHGHKAVGQGGSKQRVAVGAALHPIAVFKQLGRQAAGIAQP